MCYFKYERVSIESDNIYLCWVRKYLIINKYWVESDSICFHVVLHLKRLLRYQNSACSMEEACTTWFSSTSGWIFCPPKGVIANFKFFFFPLFVSGPLWSLHANKTLRNHLANLIMCRSSPIIDFFSNETVTVVVMSSTGVFLCSCVIWHDTTWNCNHSTHNVLRLTLC